MTNIEDFRKLNINVGRIIKAEDFKEARVPAYKLEIDFGPIGIKKSSAQITKLYKKEDLIGKQIVAVTNFPPKQIANFVSEVLVLGSVIKDGKVILLTTEQDAPLGSRIS